MRLSISLLLYVFYTICPVHLVKAASLGPACGAAISIASVTRPNTGLCASGIPSTVSGPLNWSGNWAAAQGTGYGKWQWSCSGTSPSTTIPCIASAGMPGREPSNAEGDIGNTSYTTLPFQSNVFAGAWGSSAGLDPMNLFAGVNPSSIFSDPTSGPNANTLGAARQSASSIEAKGLVPISGAQRWEDTWVISFPDNTTFSQPQQISGLMMSIPAEAVPYVDADRANFKASTQPEFAAWANWYLNRPQYWDTSSNGGTVPSYFQPWNAQWGFIPMFTPLDAADCPPGMTSCTYGDFWAYQWGLTSAMSGAYAVGLSDFTDSFPHNDPLLSGFNPRNVAAFGAQKGLTVPRATAAVQASWIFANAYSLWNDYISQGEANFFSSLSNRLGAATGRVGLVIDQCQGSPLIERVNGQDFRLIASTISTKNYMCGFDDHVLNADDRRGPLTTPIITEVSGYAMNAAYEPNVRLGANMEADDAALNAATAEWYGSLSAADQSEAGYKLLKRLWLYSSWAHIADRSGNVRRALAYVSRDYWDTGTLTAPQLGPLQSLISQIIPTMPFGPAVYYSGSAMRAAETYLAQGAGADPPGNIQGAVMENTAFGEYVDHGGLGNYFVSDAALSQIEAGTVNAPTAWIVLQDAWWHDSLNDIPAAELAKLKSIAPVIEVSVGGFAPKSNAASAVAQLQALPNQPLSITTTGGPVKPSAACIALGYGLWEQQNGQPPTSTELTGFGFVDQNTRLIVVVNNPSPCPDATSLSGLIKLAEPGMPRMNGSGTITDLFAGTTTTFTISNSTATIPVTIGRWDTQAFALTLNSIFPAQ